MIVENRIRLTILLTLEKSCGLLIDQRENAGFLRKEEIFEKGAFVAAAVAALLFLGGCGEKNPQPVQSPLVRISAGAGSGSGVIYAKQEEQLVIATAGHVLAGAAKAGEIEITFWDDSKVVTGNYMISKTSETAFVNVPLELLSGEESSYPCVTVDKESFDSLAQGAEMTLLGRGGENQVREMEGTLIYPWIYVEDFAQDMMLVEGESVPGMSGGGLFDSGGNYVGILCGVNDMGETAVVPLSVIFAEYAQEY